jgi:hypothetical protein
VRNVRRLQLVCLNLFYERIQLDMPRCDSEPTSKPAEIIADLTLRAYQTDGLSVPFITLEGWEI